MDLARLRDRRVIIAAAVGLVLLAALAFTLLRRHKPPASAQAAAAPRSLQVEMGHDEPGLDPDKPLRCFVGGQFVGMTTLKDCASKNGVETGSLDVGLDPSGEVAAATSDAAVLQPLPSAPQPPAPVAPEPGPLPPPAAATPVAATGACWRFEGDWRKLGEDLSLDACVQALYAGSCARPGQADYGRWATETLRLVAGKVERSPDNKTFRTLVKQPPGDCSIPHLSE